MITALYGDSGTFSYTSSNPTNSRQIQNPPEVDYSLSLIERESQKPGDRSVEWSSWLFPLPGVTHFAEVRGNIDLRTEGEYKSIIVDGFPGKAGDKVTDKSLESLGITIEAERCGRNDISGWPWVVDQISVRSKFTTTTVVGFEVLDAAGRLIDTTLVTNPIWGDDPSYLFEVGSKRPFPNGAKLRVTYHQDGRVVRVPIISRDLEFPPVEEAEVLGRLGHRFAKTLPAGTHPLREVFGGGLLSNVMVYLCSQTVRNEIGFNDAEKQEMVRLVELWEAGDNLLSDDPSLTKVEQQKRQAEYQLLDKKLEAALRVLLTGDRMDCLCQLVTQLQGPVAYITDLELLLEDPIRIFAFSPNQQASINDLFVEFMEQMATAERDAEDVNPDTLDAAARAAQKADAIQKYEDIERKIAAEIVKLMTPAQLEKLRELEGKPFDVERARQEIDDFHAKEVRTD